MNLKKFTQKDKFGNMLSYEFEANVPEMTEIPPAFQPGPKGTDTVPAWLTPGENVINAEASRLPGVQPMLDKLNDMGRSIQKEQGGSIPSYAAEGKSAGKDTGMRTVTDKKVYETPDGYKVSEQRITVGDNTHGYGHIPTIYNGMQYKPQQVEEMLYQGQIPQPDMRFKTPTEADYYARLNSQNLMNFRDDASYLQEGEFVSKITPKIVDAVMQTESGGDVNAVSETGAAGPYQIQLQTALNPGYGIQPISDQDRFNPKISRKFATDYLKGIERDNPNFNLDQILQSYHSGVGNVLKSIGGVEELGPRGQAYADKVKSNMKEVPEVTYDMTSEKPGIFSAMASTGDANTKESETTYNPFNPKFYESGQFGDLDQLKRAIGYPLEIFGVGGVPESAPGKPPGNVFSAILPEPAPDKYKEINTKYQRGLRENKIKNSKTELDAFNKRIEEQMKNGISPTSDDLKRKIELENDLKEKQKDLDNYNKKDSKIEEEKRIEQEKINKAFKINQKKKSVKVAKDIESIVGNDPSGGVEVANLYQQDQDTILNNGLKLGEKALKEVGGWFEQTFKDMFDGPELARMAILYAGSRALGYNHNASLGYSAKSYLKRIDDQATAANKFALSEKARDDFTLDSLKKYAETRDINDLQLKAVDKSLTKVTGELYLPGYGRVTTYEGADKKQYAKIPGYGNVRTTDPRFNFEPLDKTIHGDEAVTKSFNTFEENYLSELNKGLETTDEKYVGNDITGRRINEKYRDILRRNYISINEASNLRIQMEEAVKDYYNAKRLAKETGGTVPQSIEGYVNSRIEVALSGLRPALFTGASVEVKDKIVKRVKSSMDLKSKDVKTLEDKAAYRKEYKREWAALREAYGKLSAAERTQFTVDAEKLDNHSGFTLFLERTSDSEIEELLKSR